MDAEQAIAEIERLEHIYAVPDARPMSLSDSRLRIADTTTCSRIARRFGFGSSTAFAADLKLMLGDGFGYGNALTKIKAADFSGRGQSASRILRKPQSHHFVSCASARAVFIDKCNGRTPICYRPMDALQQPPEITPGPAQVGNCGQQKEC